jgi:hypothetical protein
VLNNLGRNNHRNELHNNTMVFYSRWVRKVIVVVCCSCQIYCVCFFFLKRKPNCRFFSFLCMFCRSLFVLLYFFFWPLCCLFFFYIRILIAPLVSSISCSYVLSLRVQYLNDLSYFVNIMCCILYCLPYLLFRNWRMWI